ncbi:hypothetical protein [Hyunsoonleella pacifica]|uniref:Uncharacterized protein n=1 Tax=Hyunsoonleella pacifica TaxID=1080224 RepID=A0A4Q9FQ83_9FLAO|nr:hypothetical protein [Hyunsoonleella pacifica]TBN17500.1 hypothetical protein EYD46_04070 [Hyunsoonleella pacifica]GGD11473.1 hypothetical protein GCM10011368_11790 [Hyunsoonleella pacifica]
MRVSQSSIRIIFVFTLCIFNLLSAQPEFGSREEIEGIVIFHDKTSPLLFYYEPGDLILDKTANGTPDFRFLDMRYTGTKCYDDIGEKRFKSLLQFGVVMKKIEPETLKRIKTRLKKHGNIKIKPLPISHINTRLILPVENNKYATIDHDGALEAADKSGFSSSKSFWTKRTYTVSLTKYESQLFNKQLKNKLIGLSLNYSYNANVWFPNEESISGSRDVKAHFEKDSVLDTANNIKNKIVKNNTLSIEIDTDKFTEVIKQIDLNEEIPPTYAAVEVKCYDFTENLRPELYMKIIEVEAVSVNNSEPITYKVKFLEKHPSLFTQHINFPYAVNMNLPMRYRVTEIDTNGKRKILDWVEKPECSSVIDVTSVSKEQKIVNNVLDVEIDKAYFDDEITHTIEFQLIYHYNNQITTQTLVFQKEDNIPVKSIHYKSDKESEVLYTTKRKNENDEVSASDEKILQDDYIFINYNE